MHYCSSCSIYSQHNFFAGFVSYFDRATAFAFFRTKHLLALAMKAANFQVVLYLLALGIMVLMLPEGVARIINLAAESKTVSAFKLNRLVEGKGCHCFSHREFSPIMFAEVARVSRIDVIIVLKRSKASCN